MYDNTQKNTVKNYTQLLQPAYIVRIVRPSITIVSIAAAVVLMVSLYLGIIEAPTDIQQGEYYRIIYIHVPAAWTSLLLYVILTVCSLAYLVTKHPVAPMITRSVSKIGTLCTLITLITGSLWGYPMWGTFWVWDARLTSVLILFFIYLTHLSIGQYAEKTYKTERIASIFAIIGFINIPIIKYSVEWWTTLHQGTSITQFKNSIHPTILLPLLLMFTALMLCACYVILCDFTKEVLVRKIRGVKTRE